MTDDQPIPLVPQTNQNADNNSGHPTNTSPSAGAPEVKAPPSYPGYKITCEKKRDGWDYAKMGAEFVGLAFLILYTLYTCGIYTANHDAAVAAQNTLGQIKLQTTLLREQLKGSEAAFLEVYVASGTQVGDFDTAFNILKIVVRNSGRTIATDVTVHVSVTRTTIDGRLLGKPLIYEIKAPVLDYKPGTSEIVKRFIFEDSSTAAKVLEAAKHLEQTRRIEWSYSYGDGFGDKIGSEISCREFLSTDWVPCENFPAMLHDLRSKK
jgi:hypothetical protein